MPADAVRARADEITDVGDEIQGSGHAMASRIQVRAARPGAQASGAGMASAGSAHTLRSAVEQSMLTFHEVERACTRFDPTSALSRVNASPTRWHAAPPVLLAAIAEAHAAYSRTAGRFDPRVLDALLALGYDSSLVFGSDRVVNSPRSRPGRRGAPTSWRPRLRHARRAVHLRGTAIDLGGIGKGLAVRWASERLSRVSKDFLVEAGGDCYCAGRAPGGGTWQIGVEDPFGGTAPVAVLALSDRAVATSSTRLRRWRSGGSEVHHLIDPATARPGGDGLRAVTVVGRDPAWAEVWSKVLFLEGARDIAAAARRRGIDALWVDDDGKLATSGSLEAVMIWRAS